MSDAWSCPDRGRSTPQAVALKLPTATVDLLFRASEVMGTRFQAELVRGFGEALAALGLAEADDPGEARGPADFLEALFDVAHRPGPLEVRVVWLPAWQVEALFELAAIYRTAPGRALAAAILPVARERLRQGRKALLRGAGLPRARLDHGA